jgi:hypothetical protein
MSTQNNDRDIASGMSSTRHLSLIGIWSFPYVLALAAYLAGVFMPSAASLRSPVLVWPVPEALYGWLLLMVILSVAWLIAEFISVTNRDTIVIALQWDAVISLLTAVIFTGMGGWFLGTGSLEWWIVVPWIASTVDAITAAWLGINNAAQKPFLGQRGTR